MYHDGFRDEVRDQLLAVDAALVWVNPIEGGRDRRVLDGMLREVAEAGVFVSAHPDVVLALGTKDVLYETRPLGWGSDVHRYASLDELRRGLPARLAAGKARVLEQRRGNGGDGVWKVELAAGRAPASPEATPRELPGPDAIVRVRHALRGSPEEEIRLDELHRRFEGYFAGDGRVIDQAYQERLAEGMVRCYLVQPGPRLYHPPTLPAYQRLEQALEREWIPAVQRSLSLETEQLPILWDCDFLLGPRDANGRDTYVLCEINVSSVAPYPESAVPRIVEATARRLRLGRRR